MSTIRFPAAVTFKGPKICGAIPVASDLHRTALVQLSLDPAAEGIGFVASTSLQGRHIALNATVVQRDGRRHYLDIAELRDPKPDSAAPLAFRHLGLAPFERTAAAILRDPVHANCAAIWRHCRDRVAAEDEFEVLHVLGDDGPQRLARLASAARVAEQTLLAMACLDLVEIDVHEEFLGPRTMIRRRDRVRPSHLQIAAAF